MWHGWNVLSEMDAWFDAITNSVPGEKAMQFKQSLPSWWECTISRVAASMINQRPSTQPTAITAPLGWKEQQWIPAYNYNNEYQPTI